MKHNKSHRHSKKKRISKLGLSPGSPIFTGEKKVMHTSISEISYSEENYDFREKIHTKDVPGKKTDQVKWFRISGLHETDVLEEIRANIDLHPLLLEDILNIEQNPKIEIADNFIFISLKHAFNKPPENLIEFEQISLLLLDNMVLVFQEGDEKIFSFVENRLLNLKGRIRRHKADYLFYALLDTLIDYYFEVLEKIEGRYQNLEEKILQSDSNTIPEDIHQLKEQVLICRKYIRPLRDLVQQILRDESVLIEERVIPFFRDLDDHCIQLIERIEMQREMINSLMDLHFNQLSIRMNEVMKVLTIIATIFIPLSFLAGIFGMNFNQEASPFNMPELSFRYGYPLFWLLTILVSGGLLVYFKRKKWL